MDRVLMHRRALLFGAAATVAAGLCARALLPEAAEESHFLTETIARNTVRVRYTDMRVTNITYLLPHDDSKPSARITYANDRGEIMEFTSSDPIAISDSEFAYCEDCTFTVEQEYELETPAPTEAHAAFRDLIPR